MPDPHFPSSSSSFTKVATAAENSLSPERKKKKRKERKEASTKRWLRFLFLGGERSPLLFFPPHPHLQVTLELLRRFSFYFPTVHTGKEGKRSFWGAAVADDDIAVPGVWLSPPLLHLSSGFPALAYTAAAIDTFFLDKMNALLLPCDPCAKARLQKRFARSEEGRRRQKKGKGAAEEVIMQPFSWFEPDLE